jgi:hypothetical protein
LKEDDINFKQKRLHLFYGIAIFILVFALVLTNFFNFTGLSHTRQLSRFKENLISLKSPTKSFPTGSFSEVGHVYYGNGDNCDYIAGKMYETDLSKEEIIKFYSVVSLPSVNGKEKIQINVLFYEQKSPRGRLMYQIQIFEDALDAGFDIRCS